MGLGITLKLSVSMGRSAIYLDVSFTFVMANKISSSSNATISPKKHQTDLKQVANRNVLLGDEDLKEEDLKEEITREKSINEVSKQIVSNARLTIDATRLIATG